MNRNIRVAKELVRLAKSLLASEERVAKWDWRHPFTFDAKQQELNEIEKKIKNGDSDDTILVRFTDLETVDNSNSHGGDVDVLVGKIIAPEGVRVTPADLNLGGTNEKCMLRVNGPGSDTFEKVDEVGDCHVVYGIATSELEKEFNGLVEKSGERKKKEIEERRKRNSKYKPENYESVLGSLGFHKNERGEYEAYLYDKYAYCTITVYNIECLEPAGNEDETAKKGKFSCGIFDESDNDMGSNWYKSVGVEFRGDQFKDKLMEAIKKLPTAKHFGIVDGDNLRKWAEHSKDRR